MAAKNDFRTTMRVFTSPDRPKLFISCPGIVQGTGSQMVPVKSGAGNVLTKRAINTRWNNDGSVTASATVVWHSPELTQDNTTTPIAQERIEVTVYSRTKTYRIVEFQLEFLALLPNVRIGGSEDAKGYGGFSPRIKLSADQTFVSDGKPVEPVKEAITAGPWVDISNAKSGIAILTHPSNPGSPEPRILRRKRSMQNARYPGADPISLSTDTPLIQRYQLVIHNGPTDSKLLNGLHSEFASSGK